MANPNTPYGLRPYSYVHGAPYAGAVRIYAVPANNGTALYYGDPVKLITNSSDANGVQNVVIGSAGGGAYTLGSFMGVANNAGQLVIPVLQNQTPYLPASTAAYVYVTDDPTILYAIQEDGLGGAMVAGASGRNADLVSGSGSTITSQSGWMLDSSTLQTTNTLQLRIIQLLQEPDNAVGLSAKWLVKLNLSSMLNLTGV